MPLEFRNIPDALEIVGNPPDSVDVRLRGSSAVLSRLQPGEIVAVLDLSSARPGSRLFPHPERRSAIAVRRRGRAGSARRRSALELEKSALRTVPVVAGVDGEPAPGFVIGTRTAEPATVEIAGPESRVKQIADATTEPVSVAGARVSVRDVVTVGVVDASVRLTKPQNATVMVEILPAPVERELTGVPVRCAESRHRPGGAAGPAGLARGPSSADGGRRWPRCSAETIDAFVDLAGLGPGRYNLRVQVDPAQQFGVDEITPTTVDVTIRAIK